MQGVSGAGRAGATRTAEARCTLPHLVNAGEVEGVSARGHDRGVLVIVGLQARGAAVVVVVLQSTVNGVELLQPQLLRLQILHAPLRSTENEKHYQSQRKAERGAKKGPRNPALTCGSSFCFNGAVRAASSPAGAWGRRW